MSVCWSAVALGAAWLATVAAFAAGRVRARRHTPEWDGITEHHRVLDALRDDCGGGDLPCRN